MERADIRKYVRQHRRGLTNQQQTTAARALCQQALRWRRFLNSQRIAFYLPNDGELDLRPLMKIARGMGKRCYLPVISNTTHNRLWFAPYEAGQALKPNCFNIPEPASGKFSGLPAQHLDLILMPLVAFDVKGNRLGMGGGFYDRTLAYLRQRNHWQRPYLAGVAYEFQRVDTLPAQDWDVPLNAVITEQSLYKA